MTDPIVTMRHVRKAGYCRGGARLFCRNYKLDWHKFLKEGVRASVIEAKQDPQGLAVVRVARDER